MSHPATSNPPITIVDKKVVASGGGTNRLERGKSGKRQLDKKTGRNTVEILRHSLRTCGGGVIASYYPRPALTSNVTESIGKTMLELKQNKTKPKHLWSRKWIL